MDETNNGTKPARGAAIAVTLFGAAMLALATGIIPARESDFHAPRWVLGSIGVGLLFVAVGLAWQHVETRWTSLSTLAGIALALVVPPLWIAFGLGPRHCSGGLGAMGLTFDWISPDVECRIAFGAGGALVLGMLLMGVGAWLRTQVVPLRIFGYLEKTGLVLVLLVLAPLLLAALLVSLPVAFAKKLYSRKAGPDS